MARRPSGEGEDENGSALDADRPAPIANPSAFTARWDDDDATHFDVSWGTGGREAYDLRCKPIAIDRMKSAARNLTLLLDTIFKQGS